MRNLLTLASNSRAYSAEISFGEEVAGVGIWMIIAAVLAAVGGILLYFFVREG